MASADPSWLSSSLAIAASFGTAATAYLIGRKKKGEPEGGNTGQVVMGSFMERQAVSDLGVSMRNLDGTLRSINEELGDLNRHLHDEALVRRMREGK